MRFRCLLNSWLQDVREHKIGGLETEDIAVASMGPLGHVYYLKDSLTDDQKSMLSHHLVHHEKLPGVLFKTNLLNGMKGFGMRVTGTK